MTANQRSPNWDVWCNVPYACAWEAIALSLDIDPHKIRIAEGVWMAGVVDDYPHAEDEEFAGRLLVLRRNLSTFKLRFEQLGRPDYCSIELGDFVAWARRLGWKMPSRLEAIPESKTQEMESSAFDPDDDTYPPELDAACIAWRHAATNSASGRLPKQLIEEFLTANYPAFSKEARERIATVCNWAKKGGAPKR